MNQVASVARMQCMEVWGGNRETNRGFEMPGVNVWVNSRPDGDAAAGGDVYYLSSCASGRITRVLLADVSGHGEEAAEVATGLRDMMRQNVNVIRQDRLVAEINQRFSQFTNDSRFATAIVATYFAPNRTLMLSNAGHPPPLHFSARQQRWSEVVVDVPESQRISDTPWGVYDDADYPTARIKVSKGDRILCYSDAVIETEIDGQQLGVEGVLQHLNESPSIPPTEVVPRLLESIRERQKGALIQDDMTFILLEFSDTRTTLKNNLLAPFRLLRPVRLRTDLHRTLP